MSLAHEVEVLIPTLASLPIAVMTTDSNGVICWANTRLSDLSGYGVDQLVGQNAGMLESDNGESSLHNILLHVVASGQSWKGESVGRRKNGESYDIEQTITPIRDGSGAVTHALWTVRDIAGHKLATGEVPQLQKALSAAQQQTNDAAVKAERHYHRIFNSVSDAVFIHKMGEDGQLSQFVDVNDAACRYLGYTREELLRMRLWDITSPERHPAVAAILQRLRPEGQLIWEGADLAKDGRRIPVEINAHVFDFDGAPMMIACVRDLTERKEAETKYRDIFDGAFEGMYRTTPQGQFLSVNPAFARLLGYDSSQELISSDAFVAHQFWSEPDRRLRYLALLEERGSVQGYECQAKRKDGTPLWLSLSARKICGPDGKTAYYEGFSEDITGRTRIEAALRKSEEKFAKVFLSSPCAIVLCDTDDDHRIIDVNAAFEEISGYRPEEAIGRTAKELALWADARDLDESMKQCRAAGRIHNLEHLFRKKSGQIGTGLLSAESLELDGRPCSIVAIIDITERVTAEAQLKSIANAIPGVVFQFYARDNGECGLYYLSDRCLDFAEIHGESLADAFQKLTAQIHPEDRDRFIASIEESVRSASKWEFDGRYIKPTGGEVCFRGISDATRRERETVFSGILLDITGRKRAEEALQIASEALAKAEHRYRLMFNSVLDAVMVHGMEADGSPGRFIEVNDVACHRLGYTREELLQLRPSDVDAPETIGTVLANVKRLLKEGQAVWEGVQISKEGRRIPVEISKRLFDFEGSPTIIASVRDITERKEAEVAQTKLGDQLRQAQKMESIGKLAGGVAHDFNNLLTVINGYNGFLLGQLKPFDPLRSYAEEIRNAGERAAALTKQLLAFSRKQIVEPRAFDLNATVRVSAPMLQRLIGEDIVLETHLDERLGQVMADPGQIHQVIMNLAVNARDAMPDGGNLNIATVNVDLDAQGCTAIHPDAVPGRYVLLTVTDTGHGMDETLHQQIFEPFFTTKEIGKGTGLGLATVYGIIRQSGGWVDVSSEVGVGTSFKVYLPRIDGYLAPKQDEIIPSAEGGSETILVVEDQQAVRSFTKTALKQYGYHVIEASDGEEAIVVARQHSGELHLLLTDVVLPGMNGRELSEQLKELRPNLKVLFVSGYTAEVIAHHGVLDPGVALLHKPFSPEELAARVRDILVGSTKPVVGS